MKRSSEAGAQHVLMLSYGKDSLACLGAIEHLGWPIDRIVTAELWATDTLRAEYPPVVEFKERVNDYIKRRYGITVEPFCATKVYGIEKEKVTYNDIFYYKPKAGKFVGTIKGFPMQQGSWCKRLKVDALKAFAQQPGIVQYLGIAADEPERVARYKDRADVRLPLVENGWDQGLCGLWCKYNGILSPTYTTASLRDGCWFCHNQGVAKLRLLRKDYPDLWAQLLEWDKDSPVTFKACSGGSPGRTVHEYDKRFQMEDEGLIMPDELWRWEYLDSEMVNYRLF